MNFEIGDYLLYLLSVPDLGKAPVSSDIIHSTTVCRKVLDITNDTFKLSNAVNFGSIQYMESFRGFNE